MRVHIREARQIDVFGQIRNQEDGCIDTHMDSTGHLVEEFKDVMTEESGFGNVGTHSDSHSTQLRFLNQRRISIKTMQSRSIY